MDEPSPTKSISSFLQSSNQQSPDLPSSHRPESSTENKLNCSCCTRRAVLLPNTVRPSSEAEILCSWSSTAWKFALGQKSFSTLRTKRLRRPKPSSFSECPSFAWSKDLRNRESD